jgi:hypothetical protein
MAVVTYVSVYLKVSCSVCFQGRFSFTQLTSMNDIDWPYSDDKTVFTSMMITKSIKHKFGTRTDLSFPTTVLRPIHTAPCRHVVMSCRDTFVCVQGLFLLAAVESRKNCPT